MAKNKDKDLKNLCYDHEMEDAAGYLDRWRVPCVLCLKDKLDNIESIIRKKVLSLDKDED